MPLIDHTRPPSLVDTTARYMSGTAACSRVVGTFIHYPGHSPTKAEPKAPGQPNCSYSLHPFSHANRLICIPHTHSFPSPSIRPLRGYFVIPSSCISVAGHIFSLVLRLRRSLRPQGRDCPATNPAVLLWPKASASPLPRRKGLQASGLHVNTIHHVQMACQRRLSGIAYRSYHRRLVSNSSTPLSSRPTAAILRR